jgi:beta-glucosidase
MPVERRFPDGFVWGVATSAYQIEGAPNEDGKGRSIWDTYTHTPGAIKDGSTGDVANDHYHRYKDDVRLMKEIGAKAYRFSIAWPRIFPNGIGEPNAKGLDFYSRLVDELLAAGIEPFATLYHWDLPQAVQDRGGWQSRDTSHAFADYAGYVAGKLSDRVPHFFTINEFHSVVELGHRGVDIDVGGKRETVRTAPGLTLPPAELNQVRHHAVLAHGLAVRAIRANARPGTGCGPAENITVAVPLVETPDNVRAAEAATREMNAQYLTVILEGRYTDRYLESCGQDAPKFTAADLAAIGEPVDFVGINVYRPGVYVVASDGPAGYREVPWSPSHPKMFAPWLMFGPEALYWAPAFVRSLWQAKAIYVTENGCAADDRPAADGSVSDTDRVMYLRSYLTQLHRATAEGAPVKGYFAWSLMDNFEWADGFGTRFGLVYVDFATQNRTPKMSASYFREAAARNAIV